MSDKDTERMKDGLPHEHVERTREEVILEMEALQGLINSSLPFQLEVTKFISTRAAQTGVTDMESLTHALQGILHCVGPVSVILRHLELDEFHRAFNKMCVEVVERKEKEDKKQAMGDGPSVN